MKKEEDDNELEMNLNDFDSGIQLEEPKSNKKIIIMSIVIILLLLLIAVVIFIIYLPSDEEETYELICTYNIQDISKPNNILSEEYNLDLNTTTIYLRDIKIKTKTYNFSSTGNHTIQYKINEKEINMNYMFKDVSTLISIEMKSDDDRKIISMISTFENCHNLNKFSISGFNFEKINSTKKLFYNTNLTEIDTTFLKTENIEDMSYMFSDCVSLTSLDLSSFNTSKLKNMANMFRNCQKLETLNLSEIDTSKVTDMSYLFDKCYNLKDIDILNFNTSKVENMNFMFQDCKSLQNINFGKSFDTSLTKEMIGIFRGCKSLTSIDISNFDTSNVEKMDFMFSHCINLK